MDGPGLLDSQKDVKKELCGKSKQPKSSGRTTESHDTKSDGGGDRQLRAGHIKQPRAVSLHQAIWSRAGRGA